MEIAWLYVQLACNRRRDSRFRSRARTTNLRAKQLLLGHTKLESAVRYLGIEVEAALEFAEQTEV